MPLYDDDPGVNMSHYPWPSVLWMKPKQSKRTFLRVKRTVYPISVYLIAVVEIQRVWRGVLLRRRVLSKYLHHKFKRGWKIEEGRMNTAYRTLPRAGEEQFMGLLRLVQERWRTTLVRREYLRWEMYNAWPIYYVAAATIQRAWADFRWEKHQKMLRNRSKKFFLTREDAAAGRIQDSWRRYVNRQVFAFYVDLIRFREQGDPQLMLRCINPKEGKLVDAAAGLHVRFRLGGSTFPPTIYYKIFTHNNVADVCSFAPKDYVTLRKHATPAMRHNKQMSAAELKTIRQDRSRWYRRVDNNDWRPISDNIMRNAEAIAEAASKKFEITTDQPFHWSRLLRRQERQNAIKKKRRTWLMKLYTTEQLSHSEPHQEELIKSQAQAIFDGMTDEEVEDEAARLVQWTAHLDFEAYSRTWMQLATTAASDAVVGPNAAGQHQQPSVATGVGS